MDNDHGDKKMRTSATAWRTLGIILQKKQHNMINNDRGQSLISKYVWVIETGGESIERFTDAQLSGDLLIKPVLTSKLNKLRIGLPEAYFYWAKTSQLMK